MMVDVSRAVWAVVAVDILAAVALVGLQYVSEG